MWHSSICPFFLSHFSVFFEERWKSTVSSLSLWHYSCVTVRTEMQFHSTLRGGAYWIKHIACEWDLASVNDTVVCMYWCRILNLSPNDPRLTTLHALIVVFNVQKLFIIISEPLDEILKMFSAYVFDVSSLLFVHCVYDFQMYDFVHFSFES